MDYTPRESTIPNEQQLEELAARYAEQHPDGPPTRTHRLSRLFRHVLPDRDRNGQGPANLEPPE